MSAATDRFNQVQADYLDLARGFLARWDRALSDVRERRYSVSNAMSDALGYWMDAATFSFNLVIAPKPLEKGAGPSEVPTVSLTLDARRTAASAAKAVDLPSDTPVVATKLTRSDQVAEGQIAAANVSAHLEDGGRVLVVQLDLGRGRRPPAGEYTGLVKGAADATVAFITVTVR
jgi:hypothetical protein